MSFDEAAFQKLRSGRLAFVEGLQQNEGFGEGIRRLLTQLYPDNAHFIYELLQNAEDALATHARFVLSEGGLVFEHDGSRLFSARDVEGITSFANSQKADSPTEIGKFGVGFKAVFAYTQTPEISSGKYHFLIRDLFVPELLQTPNFGPSEFKTRFVFPFDHPKKGRKEAADEIVGALRALDDAALLFLSNIRRISYALPDGSEGKLERGQPLALQQKGAKGDVIEVTIQGGLDDLRRSCWLRYWSVVTIDDESKAKECRVAVAYKLEEVEGRAKKSAWHVIPQLPGRVSIYFPAEKETSNLRFNLHAPFASTVARDSVRESAGNKQLLEALASLAAESMEDVRDRGMLTMAFLEVLPIPDDSIPTFYRPVRERLVDAFKNRDLVPTRYAGHRAANELFRGPSDIVNLLNDEDLAFLTRGQWEDVAWCANAPQANQRADKFLDSLGIDKWGWSELCDSIDGDAFRLSEDDETDRRSALGVWLSRKEDVWLRRLYSVLHEATTRHYQRLDASELPLVRIEVGGAEEQVRPAEAFFPNGGNQLLPDDLQLVKAGTYQSGKAEGQPSSARQYLESVGVRVFDEAADLERLILSYEGRTLPDLSVHLLHMRRVLEFFKAHPNQLDIFRGKAILIGQKLDGQGQLECSNAKNLYLDSPFEETGLAGTVVVNGKFALWSGYEKISAKKTFVEFVRALGIHAELPIISVTTLDNPEKQSLRQDWYQSRVRRTDSGIDKDWTIECIQDLVAAPTVEGSRLLWTTLTRANPAVAVAQFRPNRQYDTRQADSQLVNWLKNKAWVPDTEGRFHLPKGIGRAQLPPGFLYDNRNGLLTAIGFEESIQRETDEYRRKDSVAKEFGFDGIGAATALARAIRESGIDSKAAAALIRQHAERPDQPEEEVRNPSRRRRGVIEHRDNAPENTAVRRERAIQPNLPGVVAEAKAYLRAKYTNAHGQMVCQICLNEMPFRLRTGEYYFEAVQVLKGLAQHFYENRLALCPTCAAMYQFARISSDEDVRAAIVAVDDAKIEGRIAVSIVLAGEQHRVHFVGTHFFDLQVVISQ